MLIDVLTPGFVPLLCELYRAVVEKKTDEYRKGINFRAVKWLQLLWTWSTSYLSSHPESLYCHPPAGSGASGSAGKSGSSQPRLHTGTARSSAERTLEEDSKTRNPAPQHGWIQDAFRVRLLGPGEYY